MALDWTVLIRGTGFDIDGDDVVVDVGFDRKQRISVTAEPDGLHLASVISRRGSDADGVGRLAWERNRTTAIVGFRIDRHGRLIGEAWVPNVGLTRDELELVLRHVAAECDRLEHLRTGKDEY